ncbi:MAG: ribokinase, partial [Pseudomonadota bacterium]
MAVYCLGSINIDHFYRLAHLPAPGETLAAAARTVGLGGKGANQSVAAACAGAEVFHIGAIGADGCWVRDRIASYGIRTDFIAEVDGPTGHAIILVDPAGENSIVILSGANIRIGIDMVRTALARSVSEDILLIQNETNMQVEAAEIAKKSGMKVIYSAAPFAADAVKAVLPHVDLLILNDIEARQLATATGKSVDALPVSQILVTHGSEGATWRSNVTGEEIRRPAFPVKPVDTTAAGDVFCGYLAAAVDGAMPVKKALELAAAAAA